MRKTLLLLFAVLSALFLTALPKTALPLAAQNNPYDIDDECYALFTEAEDLMGKPGFKEVNEALLAKAREKGDAKAEVLYYVDNLKNLTPVRNNPENDVLVDAAHEVLKEKARESGYMQYYYYSYQLTVNYYYNNQRTVKSFTLLQEMQDIALKEHDDYGLWTALRYMTDLYIHVKDYPSAKTYIIRALNLYNTSTDEKLLRQSPSRLYFDLADTYPIGDDSVRINIQKGLATIQTHLDSVRAYYYVAKLAVVEGDIDRYKIYKEKYLADPKRQQLGIGDAFFDLADAVLDGTIDQRFDDIRSLRRIRQYKLIANLCEEYGFKDFGFKLERELVKDMERTISRNNMARLSELDVTLGKAKLSADLADSEQKVNRVTRLLTLSILALMTAALLFSLVHIRQLQRTNKRVRMADAAKTRFVQNMSHEVRTPLNAIVGFSQLLSLPDGMLQPEEKDEFAGHIVSNTKMLTMLLDDILNASAMDKGDYRIRYEQGELHQMCQEALSSTEHRLQPGVSLTYEPESTEPHHFFADPQRVQQILINLLSNACKHTSKGSIVLRSSLTSNPGFITFSVTDTGPGVPAEKAEAIFERFTKLNEFVQGTGLGLSICRDIASRMEGRVYLDPSYEEGGARFIFMIPDRQEMPEETSPVANS